MFVLYTPLQVIENRRKEKAQLSGGSNNEIKIGNKKLLDFIDILMETKVCLPLSFMML